MRFCESCWQGVLDVSKGCPSMAAHPGFFQCWVKIRIRMYQALSQGIMSYHELLIIIIYIYIYEQYIKYIIFLDVLILFRLMISPRVWICFCSLNTRCVPFGCLQAVPDMIFREIIRVWNPPIPEMVRLINDKDVH